MEKIVLLKNIIIPEGTVFKKCGDKGLYQAIKLINDFDKVVCVNVHTIKEIDSTIEKWFRKHSSQGD
jgi:hypothetical protein